MKTKMRITTNIDCDLLSKIKKEAAKKNTSYQTLINKVLRENFLPDVAAFKVQSQLKNALSRLDEIEKKM